MTDPYMDAHKHRLAWMPWLWDTLKPPQQMWAVPWQKEIQALSCVFRAGRAGALTDHSSILFDVDLKTGEIKRGTTNAHWYVQGPKGWSVPWISTHDVKKHPDVDVQVTGNRVPDIEAAVRLCVDAHRKMMPDVPMVLNFFSLLFF